MSESATGLKFDLKAMLDSYEARVGIRPSYAELSKNSGISVDTLKSLASRSSYNTTLETLAKLGTALGLDPRPFLEWELE